MAYQTRGRDPLLDSNMAQAMEKRGKELFGLFLIALGLMACAMIASYTPDDPNWMVSTDAPTQNWMGRTGASIAAPLFMIVGWGSWGLGIVLLAWGLRFALHKGAERAVGRLIFAPIAIAAGSIYAATLTPAGNWLDTHSFGLGGLFGDTVMGALLTLLPIGSVLTVKLMSLLMALGILALGAFVLGFTKDELLRIGRFLLLGLVMIYAGIMTLLGKGASGTLNTAQVMAAKASDRRAKAREAADARATEVAPAMGLIGTLIGLVQMLGNLSDPSTIGPATSVALLTTFYGAILAHMVFIPISIKAERNSHNEATINALYITAIMSIRREENPRTLELHLNSMLPPTYQLNHYS